MKRLNYRIVAALLLNALIIFSCRKEKTDESTIYKVFAGHSDAELVAFDIVPSLEIMLNWDSLNHYAYGSDSLDLDLNGNSDIVFSESICNPDSLSSMPDPFPFLKITPGDGMEIAIISETYPIGLGQTSTAWFADSLNFGTRIDTLGNWTSSVINMWAENPTATLSYGSWYYSGSIMYLGLRKNNDRYGWLEVDATDPYHPKFSRFALQSEP